MKELDHDLATSVTVIRNCLIVSLTGEMMDDQIQEISNNVMIKYHNEEIYGTILDFSMVHVLDTFSFKAFERITKAVSLMGITVVWVGLRPGVVSALMDLNIDIDIERIRTAINLDHGIEVISASIQRMKSGSGSL